MCVILCFVVWGIVFVACSPPIRRCDKPPTRGSFYCALWCSNVRRKTSPKLFRTLFRSETQRQKAIHNKKPNKTLFTITNENPDSNNNNDRIDNHEKSHTTSPSLSPPMENNNSIIQSPAPSATTTNHNNHFKSSSTPTTIHHFCQSIIHSSLSHSSPSFSGIFIAQTSPFSKINSNNINCVQCVRH